MLFTRWTLVPNQESQTDKVQKSIHFKFKIFLCGFITLVCCGLAWAYFVNASDETSTGGSSFNSTEVQTLTTSYPPQNYTLNTPSLTYMLHGCVSGFGSYVNSALSVFLVALDNNLAFHVQSLGWCYLSWSSFFYDYSSHTSTPINLDQFSSNSTRWREAVGYVEDANKPDFNGHVFIEHWGENFRHVRYNMFTKIKGNVFERKKIAAQALWNPKPLISNVVANIQESYVAANNKVFISMHIRRGDKLTKEMKNLPTSLYSDKVLDLMKTKYPGRHIALFVFSDDDYSVANLRNLLGEYLNIEVFNLADAFRHHPNLQEDWLPLTQRQGYHQGDFRRSDEAYQFRQTAELITDITLAAMADEFICTFSSNIARLVSLVRTSSLDTVHSLDEKKWSNK